MVHLEPFVLESFCSSYYNAIFIRRHLNCNQTAIEQLKYKKLHDAWPFLGSAVEPVAEPGGGTGWHVPPRAHKKKKTLLLLTQPINNLEKAERVKAKPRFLFFCSRSRLKSRRPGPRARVSDLVRGLSTGRRVEVLPPNL